MITNLMAVLAFICLGIAVVVPATVKNRPMRIIITTALWAILGGSVCALFYSGLKRSPFGSPRDTLVTVVGILLTAALGAFLAAIEPKGVDIVA